MKKILIIMLLFTGIGCSLDPFGFKKINNDLDKINENLAKTNKTLTCLNKMLEMEPATIHDLVGEPCNKDIDCIEKWLELWMVDCEKKN